MVSCGSQQFEELGIRPSETETSTCPVATTRKHRYFFSRTAVAPPTNSHCAQILELQGEHTYQSQYGCLRVLQFQLGSSQLFKCWAYNWLSPGQGPKDIGGICFQYRKENRETLEHQIKKSAEIMKCARVRSSPQGLISASDMPQASSLSLKLLQMGRALSPETSFLQRYNF